MQLLPLGRLAGMPAAGQASSGYLVQHEGSTVMLDAGPGTALSLTSVLDPADLDAVVVSHLHTDHLLDLLPLGKMLLRSRLATDPVTGRTELDESTSPVPLLVPRGSLDVLRRWADLFPVTTQPLLDRAFELGFAVVEYEPGQLTEVGGLTLGWELLAHVAPNCGVRVTTTDGRSLAYTGDTGVTRALPRLAEGVDLLLSESTLRETDRSGHGHLSSADAGRAATAAGVGHLVLTHFAGPDPEDHEWHRRQAGSTYDGPVSLAHVHQPVTVDGDHPARTHDDTRKVTA